MWITRCGSPLCHLISVLSVPVSFSWNEIIHFSLLVKTIDKSSSSIWNFTTKICPFWEYYSQGNKEMSISQRWQDSRSNRRNPIFLHNTELQISRLWVEVQKLLIIFLVFGYQYCLSIPLYIYMIFVY